MAIRICAPGEDLFVAGAAIATEIETHKRVGAFGFVAVAIFFLLDSPRRYAVPLGVTHVG